MEPASPPRHWSEFISSVHVWLRHSWNTGAHSSRALTPSRHPGVLPQDRFQMSASRQPVENAVLPVSGPQDTLHEQPQPGSWALRLTDGQTHCGRGKWPGLTPVSSPSRAGGRTPCAAGLGRPAETLCRVEAGGPGHVPPCPRRGEADVCFGCLFTSRPRHTHTRGCPWR